MKTTDNYINIKKKASILKATDKTIRDIVLDGLAKFGPEADLNYIDTSEVSYFRLLFSLSINYSLYYSIGIKLKNEYKWTIDMLQKINPDVSKWDVSNAVDMFGMFYSCGGFNCNIGDWDVTNVQTTRNMFLYCKMFNQDLSRWKLHNVTDVFSMFDGCISLDQDFSTWELKSIELKHCYLGDMFNNTHKMTKDKYPPKYLELINFNLS